MKWLDELLQKKPDLDWVKIILKHVATPDRLSALKATPGNPMERAYYAREDLLVTKWHHYLAIYDRHLSRYRGQPVRLLEIGIGHGGSLQLWRDYFGPQAIIHALDIRPVCAELANDGFDVHIGNQTDRGLLNRIVAEMKGVDVVIDDGSHVCSDQIATFEILFPQLATNGIYFCEDLHTSYWAQFGGGLRASGSFIEYAKRLVDRLHSWYFEPGESGQSDPFAAEVRGIHFYDSMVVVERTPPRSPLVSEIGNRRLGAA